MRRLTDEKAGYFAHVDGVNRFALVALDPDDPDEIIAVVRYDREARTEYAALVEDLWQGRGLGLRLTRLLVDVARDRGVRCLYGLVMRGNGRMLRVLRGLDLPERVHLEGNASLVEVELQPGGCNDRERELARA